MSVERIGRDSGSGKDLFVVEVETPTELREPLQMIDQGFVCLVAWDSEAAGVADISESARQLLDAGAMYVCAWGPGCERVHDIVDEERDGGSEDNRVLMTTWHANESLADALWFVLTCAIPDDCYLAGWGAIVGISIGSPRWAAEMRAAFSEPGRFRAEQGAT